MNLTRFALSLATGIAVPSIAAAHSELHSANWCANGVVAYAGGFSISPEELRAEQDRRQQAAAQRCLQETGQLPNGGVGTCGIFDPPYEMAVAMARAACGAIDSPLPTENSPVVSYVFYPPEFNDPNHHEDFTLDAGIAGSCGVCVVNRPIVIPRDHD